MFKNYFRIAVRNLAQHKSFSFINIFGLAIGITGCILIGAFVFNELNYDKAPALASQIYRLTLQINENGGTDVYPDVDVAVGAGIKNTFPEVIASTRINGNNTILLKNG